MKLKKLMSLAVAIGLLASLSVPVMAYEPENENGEVVLELDEYGRAGATVGMIVYDDRIENFDLTVVEQEQAFNALQVSITNGQNKMSSSAPRSSVIFHVGIEMTGKTDEYRMYYEIDGIGITKASGYMKCKSTALLFPTTYHDEYFSKTSIGTTYMSGESDEFTLPSGTSKVKVGWHGVSVTYADGKVNASDKYAIVNVG